MNDHYFSARPASSERRQEIGIRLGGRELTVTTAAGTFSPGHLDTGTNVLLRALPDPPSAGHLLDLGCGWGPLALQAALTAGEGLTVWALDVNVRALELTAENARRHGLGAIRAVTAEEVPDIEFGQIWSNPPIKIGKEALHALLREWLPRLAPGGEAWLVVARKLGSDSLHTWLETAMGPGFVVRRHSSSKGFRVLVVSREA